MSMDLDRGSRPEGLRAKHFGQSIMVGEYVLSLEDLLRLAHYGLIASELKGDDDPRHAFIRMVQSMEVVDGPDGTKCLQERVPFRPA